MLESFDGSVNSQVMSIGSRGRNNSIIEKKQYSVGYTPKKRANTVMVKDEDRVSSRNSTQRS